MTRWDYDPNRRPEPEPQSVIIEGVDISIYDLMMLLVKLAIASVPALLILGVIGFAIAAALGLVGAIAG